MSDLLLGIGFLLVIFGPLLLLPATWLLYRLAARPLVQRLAPPTFPISNARWLAWLIAAMIVAGVMIASYLPGRARFDRMCSEYAEPDIAEQVQVKGFYRDDTFPYQASRYLKESAFEFVEAPHPYQEGEYVRYSKAAGGDMHQQPIPHTSAVYGVREILVQPSGSLTMIDKVIYEIATERELARAASIHYTGGPLWLFLGSYGTSSCPDIISEEGSRQFRTFYELESIVLQNRPLP